MDHGNYNGLIPDQDNGGQAEPPQAEVNKRNTNTKTLVKRSVFGLGLAIILAGAGYFGYKTQFSADTIAPKTVETAAGNSVDASFMSVYMGNAWGVWENGESVGVAGRQRTKAISAVSDSDTKTYLQSTHGEIWYEIGFDEIPEGVQGITVSALADIQNVTPATSIADAAPPSSAVVKYGLNNCTTDGCTAGSMDGAYYLDSKTGQPTKWTPDILNSPDNRILVGLVLPDSQEIAVKILKLTVKISWSSEGGATFNGKVVDSSGKGVAGINIKVWNRSNGTQNPSVTTITDGTFKVKDLIPGNAFTIAYDKDRNGAVSPQNTTPGGVCYKASTPWSQVVTPAASGQVITQDSPFVVSAGSTLAGRVSYMDGNTNQIGATINISEPSENPAKFYTVNADANPFYVCLNAGAHKVALSATPLNTLYQNWPYGEVSGQIAIPDTLVEEIGFIKK